MLIEFIAIESVLELHAEELSISGGIHGVRDLRLLESALAQPEASFDGEYLHRDLYEMAAAYLFHIAQNHPFADGNKRTALVTALVFLHGNGVDVVTNAPASLYDLTMAVADGSMGKAAVANELRRLFG